MLTVYHVWSIVFSCSVAFQNLCPRILQHKPSKASSRVLSSDICYLVPETAGWEYGGLVIYAVSFNWGATLWRIGRMVPSMSPVLKVIGVWKQVGQGSIYVAVFWVGPSISTRSIECLQLQLPWYPGNSPQGWPNNFLKCQTAVVPRVWRWQDYDFWRHGRYSIETNKKKSGLQRLNTLAEWCSMYEPSEGGNFMELHIMETSWNVQARHFNSI